MRIAGVVCLGLAVLLALAAPVFLITVIFFFFALSPPGFRSFTGVGYTFRIGRPRPVPDNCRAPPLLFVV